MIRKFTQRIKTMAPGQ